MTDGWTEDRKPDAQLEGIVGDMLGKYVGRAGRGFKMGLSEEGGLVVVKSS